jgi:hypothetical protein
MLCVQYIKIPAFDVARVHASWVSLWYYFVQQTHCGENEMSVFGFKESHKKPTKNVMPSFKIETL